MKKTFLTLLTIFIVLNTAFSQEKVERNDIDKILEKITELENKQEYEGALKEIYRVSKNDSSYLISLTTKSYYLIQTKQYEKAIKVTNQGLKTETSRLHYYFFLNKISGLISLEKYSEALITIDSALILYPKNYSFYYSKGVSLEKLEQIEKSVEAYKKSISFNPFYKKSHLRLGILCYKQHLTTQAMMCLNMYLLCNPDGSDSFEVLNYFNEIVKSKNENIKNENITFSKDDETFEEIDLIINNYAALNKKYKTKNKINIAMVKQNHAMLSQLKNYEGNGGFWDKNYVKFFKWIHEDELFNPFSYTISFSIKNEKYKSIVDKKVSQIESFLPKFRAKWVSIMKGDYKEVLDGKLSNVNYVFYNSTIQGYGKLENDVSVGKWIIFNESGSLASKGTFDSDGEKHELWVWYNEKGQISEQGEYNHGKIINEYLEFHNNGKLKSKSNYKNGKRQGAYEEYSKTGSLLEAVNYIDGYYDGYYQNYYEIGKGHLKYKIPYKNGKLEGKGFEYFANGDLKSEINFKDDKNEGETNTYFQNKKENIKKQYLNNKLTANCVEYYSNGNIYQEGSYKEGMLDGLWKVYYANKILSSESIYKKGKKVDIDKNYDKDGKLHYEYKYRRGNIIAYKYYNKKGEVIKEAKKKGGEFYYEGYAPNENLIIEGVYDINGGKEGEWKYYNKNEVLTSKETLKENLIDGVSLEYHSNGNIKSKTPYKEGKLEGYYSSFYSNKQLYNQGWYSNNQLVGNWITYYEDGTVKETNYYTHGKKYGTSEVFNGEGKLAFSYIYKDDNLIKKLLHNPKGEVIEETNYELTPENYSIISKFTNDKVSSSYQMRYNKKHGEYINNYFSGKLYCKGQYFDGNENGYWKWYNENGNLYKEGQYNFGVKDGIWKTYHKYKAYNKQLQKRKFIKREFSLLLLGRERKSSVSPLKNKVCELLFTYRLTTI